MFPVKLQGQSSKREAHRHAVAHHLKLKAQPRYRAMIMRCETINPVEEPRSIMREPLPKVNPERLWNSLMALAEIGATAKGGVRRLALTDMDRRGRDLVCEWFRQTGLEVRIDRIGNIFARREGTNPKAPAVATGSHIDTQPSGGKFDGNYGVLAGLEVIRRLEECKITTEYPLEVCIWTNEEGSRFTPVMMGSGVWAGAIGESLALDAVDREGLSVSGELQRIGYAGAVPCGPTIEHPAFAAYFETHIEQGPVLEEAGVPIGEVIGALGQRWFDVMVYGMDAHAGPTPMALRKDAVLAAAHLITQVNAIALAHAPHGRGTVGSVRVEPNSRNVIAGFAQLSVDFRHPDAAGLDAMETALRAETKVLASRSSLAIDIVKVSEFVPCAFDHRCRQAVAESAAALGLRCMPIVSGAGHDAVYVARRSPAGMIFIPCKDGISHNEIEDALPEHIEAGANVLLGAMLAIAKAR